MKNWGALFLLLAMSWNAHAQTTRSEFFFQAEADESFIEGNLQAYGVEHDIRVVNEQVGFSDISLSLRYESGKSDNLSIYGQIGYGMGQVELPGADIDYNGLDPVNLGLKYKYEIGPGTFFGRTNLGLGILQKMDCDSNGCNRTDGSINLAVQLGYLFTLENSFTGFALDYGLFSTDAKEEAGGNANKKCGFAITGFYEAIFVDMIFGGAFTYSRKGLVGPPSFGLFYVDETADMDASFMTLKAYARVPMTEGFSLLGSVSYDIHIDQSDDTLDSGMGYSVNLGGRIAL